MRKQILLFFLLLLNYISSGYSLVGNTYIANFKIPIISRKQNIEIEFTTNKHANLKLDGFINSEGNVYYSYDKTNKTFTYKADDVLEKIMNKYFVSLNDMYYNESDDTQVITIKSKLVRIKQKIILKRGEPMFPQAPPLIYVD